VKRGAALAAETVWLNDEMGLYMSSPVVAGDTLYALTNRNSGQFFAMDPATGKVLWTSDPRQGENAAIVAAGGRLLMLTTNSSLIVANLTPKAYEPLRKYTVAATPTWAHPAILSNGFLIKDATTLARWDLP
jgi:outer membrane protein assembly factor BamB